MSAYTDWLKTQSRDTLLSSERAFYAGMARAAEICRQHNNEKALNAQLKLAELAIREEIEGER
jgi:hypothetical protein